MVRTRFAPSPSGYLHLGNARSLVLSFLCAKQDQGIFVLRIEDTDQERTSELYLQKIYFYMAWLRIAYDEGPEKEGGIYAPYKQSERADIYQKHLFYLQEKKLVYRCFKTVEELEKTRAYQVACGLPPRYERPDYADNSLLQEQWESEKKPFVWRFKLPKVGTTIISDKARGDVVYDIANFADFPLTRQDGTFTFIFANFVDDMVMKITTVTRGEEHFSNSALQSCLYDAFNAPKPLFYHLPLLCDFQGKKLSKRDFGFSLEDLIQAGITPQAIVNYLILMGGSFEKEIFSLQEAIQRRYFDAMTSTGSIKYDVQKLTWINKQWMKRFSVYELIQELINYLQIMYPDDHALRAKITLFCEVNLELIGCLQQEAETLKQLFEYIAFLQPDFKPIINDDPLTRDIARVMHDYVISEENNQELSFDALKKYCLAKGMAYSGGDLARHIRMILLGLFDGIGIKILLKYLSREIIMQRVGAYLK